MRLIRLTEKNGAVAAIRHVSEDDEVLMVTEGGMMIRTNVAEIRRIGRATMGVKVIRLKEGDRVVSVARAEAAADLDEDLPDADDDAGANTDPEGADDRQGDAPEDATGDDT